MKIPFRSITAQIKATDYSLQKDDFDIALSADLSKNRDGFVELNGLLKGFVELECDSCSTSFQEDVEEKITLKITDRPFKSDVLLDDEKDYDIIEFLDGIIDFDEIIISEVNAIKYDYHKCKNCK